MWQPPEPVECGIGWAMISTEVRSFEFAPQEKTFIIAVQ
jgi:hypothetical protein